MPAPKEGETQKEFVKRCIPIVLEDETAKDGAQAAAICNSMWERAEQGKAMPESWLKWTCGIVPGHEHDTEAEAWACIHENTTAEGAPENQGAPEKSVAVKFLRDEDEGAIVGGYIALWGSPETKDLQGDYFTPETWLGLDEYPSVPALFHHGLDEKVGLSVIGRRVKSGTDDTGAWVEDWLDKSNQYWKMVRPLLDKQALYYSPGSAPHLVKREDDGKLNSYPIVEDTFTVIPAQHRLRPVEQIKAAYKAAGLDYPLEDDETGGGDAGALRSESDEAAAKAVLDEAKVKAVSEIDVLLAQIELEEAIE